MGSFLDALVLCVGGIFKQTMRVPKSVSRVLLSSLTAAAAKRPCITKQPCPLYKRSPQHQQRRANAIRAAASSEALNNRAAFKAAVRAGIPLFGLFLDSKSPLVAEQLAHLDYDYMLVSWLTGLHASPHTLAPSACTEDSLSANQPLLPRLSQVDIQHAPTDYANLAAMITAVNAAGKPVCCCRQALSCFLHHPATDVGSSGGSALHIMLKSSILTSRALLLKPLTAGACPR
jgi:hypothetical protein